MLLVPQHTKVFLSLYFICLLIFIYIPTLRENVKEGCKKNNKLTKDTTKMKSSCLAVGGYRNPILWSSWQVKRV